MTYFELAAAIQALRPEELQREAVVWPPGDCPAEGTVPVQGLDTTSLGTPVITTGKKPHKG